MLNKIYPRSGDINSRIFFIGNHKFALSGKLPTHQINALKIGDSICSYGNTLQNVIDGNAARIVCDVTNEEGGYYTVSAWVAAGYERKREDNLVSLLSDASKSYEFIVNPVVTSLSSHAGGNEGDQITVYGTGFSSDSSKITVTAAGYSCNVLSATPTKLDISVLSTSSPSTYGKLTTNSTSQKNGFISGSGFIHSVYNLSGYINDNTALAGTTEFKNRYVANSDKIVKLAANNFTSRSTLGELEIFSSDIADLSRTYESANDGVIGSVTRGYIVAPSAATYKFNLRSIENVTVYASSVKGSTEIDYTKEFLKSTKPKTSFSSEVEV